MSFTVPYSLDRLNNSGRTYFKFVTQDKSGHVWAYSEKPQLFRDHGWWASADGDQKECMNITPLALGMGLCPNDNWDDAIQEIQYYKMFGYRPASETEYSVFKHFSGGLNASLIDLKARIVEKVKTTRLCDDQLYIAQDYDGSVYAYPRKPAVAPSTFARCFYDIEGSVLIFKGDINEDWKQTLNPFWVKHEVVNFVPSIPVPSAGEYKEAESPNQNKEDAALVHDVLMTLGDANSLLLRMVKMAHQQVEEIPFGQHSALSKAAIMMAHHEEYPIRVKRHDGPWLDFKYSDIKGFCNSSVYKVLPKPAPWSKPAQPVNWSEIAPLFKWMATDKDGTTYLYENEPRYVGDTGCWTTGSTGEYIPAKHFNSFKQVAVEDYKNHANKLVWKRN